MNSLTKTFENSDIRLAEIDGKIWWNLKDVCASLGMGSQVHKTVKRALTPDQIQLIHFRNQLDGKVYKMLAVNRPGLLKFIWRSNKPKALVFSDWCAEVISEILQTGRYDVREHEEQIEQLQRDLEHAEELLLKERMEVERRLFIVAREAVAEWRREHAYPYTDSKWRQKNFGRCCRELKGMIYKKGNSPYVFPEKMTDAKQKLKDFYEACQRNPLATSPPVSSLQARQFYNYFEHVENVNQ